MTSEEVFYGVMNASTASLNLSTGGGTNGGGSQSGGSTGGGAAESTGSGQDSNAVMNEKVTKNPSIPLHSFFQPHTKIDWVIHSWFFLLWNSCLL